MAAEDWPATKRRERAAMGMAVFAFYAVLIGIAEGIRSPAFAVSLLPMVPQLLWVSANLLPDRLRNTLSLSTLGVEERDRAVESDGP